MAVLLEVQTGEVELVDGLDILGAQGGLGSIGDGAYVVGLGLPGEQHLAGVSITDGQIQGLNVATIHVNNLINKGLRRECHLFVKIDLHRGKRQGDAYLLPRRRGYFQMYLPAVGIFNVHHQVLAGLLHDAQFAVGHEVLHKLLLLVGHEPSEVGLVLGVDACHELYVGAEHAGCALIVIVGEAAVPRAAKVAIAPGPLFLAGTEVVAGHMEHAALGIVLVAPLEVVLGVDGHVGGGHGDVLVVGDVDTGRVVHLIIGARSDGE